jgi:hypothetical protein
VNSRNLANSFTSNSTTKELMLSTSTTSSTIKKVQSCIPPYFKMKFTLCISHTYTSTIASKLFNYKQTLQCLDIAFWITIAFYTLLTSLFCIVKSIVLDVAFNFDTDY